MSERSKQQKIWSVLRKTFGRGIVVLVPAVITFWVLRVVFDKIDGIISPIFDDILKRHIPGLGFISMLLLILMVGFLSRNLLGKAVFSFFERVISSIPLARTVYSATKDVFNAFQIGGKGKSFRQVALVEFPRKGLWTIGFVTNEISIINAPAEDDFLSVYVPNPPNPTSGMLILVPRKTLQVLDMSVEEGLKLVLSGGIVTTGSIKVK